MLTPRHDLPQGCGITSKSVVVAVSLGWSSLSDDVPAKLLCLWGFAWARQETEDGTEFPLGAVHQHLKALSLLLIEIRDVCVRVHDECKQGHRSWYLHLVGGWLRAHTASLPPHWDWPACRHREQSVTLHTGHTVQSNTLQAQAYYLLKLHKEIFIINSQGTC